MTGKTSSSALPSYRLPGAWKVFFSSLAWNVALLLTELCLHAGPRSTHVVGWGRDPFGFNAPPAGVSNVISIQPSSSAAVTLDGRIVRWGPYNNFPNLPLTNAASIVYYDYYQGWFWLVLLRDGTVVQGVPRGIPPAPVPNDVSNIVAITSDGTGYVALRGDGTLAGWPLSGQAFQNPPTDLSNVVAITSTFRSSAALLADGHVVTWGAYHISGFPPLGSITNVVAISSEQSSFIALLNDGTVKAWGITNVLDQWGVLNVPPNLGKVSSVASGAGFHLVVLEDGRVRGWGNRRNGRLAVPPELDRVLKVYPGDDYTLAIVEDPPQKPEIRENPVALSATTGGLILLSGRADGLSPLHYQWYKDTTILAGHTNRQLEFGPATSDSQGQYFFVAKNNYGSVTSSLARLEVHSDSPAVFRLVSNAQNDGEGSLRRAIVEANAQNGGTIVFSNLTESIYLRSPLPALRRDIRILGSGTNLLGVSGIMQSSLIRVAREASCEIRGVLISGTGTDQRVDEAAVAVEGSLLAENCRFEKGMNYGFGGAISNGGSLLLRSCTFTSNYNRGFGGAIFNAGELRAEDCDFIGNVAGGASGEPSYRAHGGGGGAGMGGAVFITKGTFHFVRCQFEGNQAIGGSHGGEGDIHPESGLPPLAGQGGGLFGGSPTMTAGYGGGGAGFGGEIGNPGAGEAGGVGAGSGVGGERCLGSRCFRESPKGIGRYGSGDGGGSGLGGALFSIESEGSCERCRFRNNEARGGGTAGWGLGGALFVSSGSLVLSNSIVIENQSVSLADYGYRHTSGNAFGAGVYIAGGTLSLFGSTVSSNTLKAGDGQDGYSSAGGQAGTANGAGVYVESGHVSLDTCSVSGNRAQSGIHVGCGDFGCGADGRPSIGAGIFVGAGDLVLRSSTIVENLASGGVSDRYPERVDGLGIGGGIANSNGTVVIQNTIIAGNHASPSTSVFIDVFGKFFSEGGNLIGNTNGGVGFLSNDLLNQPASLGPLEDNGGFTPTHALLAGSLAIDAGVESSVGHPTDQRGFLRPTGKRVDIGSYEYSSEPAAALELLGYQLTSPPTATLRVWSEPGLAVWIEASSALGAPWQRLGTFTNSNGAQTFELSLPSGEPNTFLRARRAP